MSIEKLTAEQEALIPLYQQKWRAIAISTEPINHQTATEAIKLTYAVIGLSEPEIIFCNNPYAAINIIIPSHMGNPMSKQLHSKIKIQPVMQLQSQLDRWLCWELDKQLTTPLRSQLHREKFELGRQLGWQLEKQLPKQLRVKVDNCIQLEHWVCTGSLLDFGISVLNCNYDQKKWEVFQLLVKSCGWIYPFKKVCIVCERPIRFSYYNSKRRPRGDGKIAIQFADGFSLVYANQGVKLIEKYILD
ncbi:hypothetical protein Cri9333_2154 [Crinalium epipsammum PCC 9333]|uniref:DUF6745 domain-containing protein n=1 Tax=Crinalium epipsammum PCC 9333 TaxID=1173022 RepID=K9VZT5_9CYAN|nr:hypothetical protein [Crinalium epipsammum]AFZ13029.1 hypothetical protein Cri9333_2154 [Crinalium epipsammum PCC 9333]